LGNLHVYTFMIAEFAMIAMTGLRSENALLDYLRAPQPRFQAPKVTLQGNTFEIEFSSQRWQNTIWNHRILLMVPKGSEKSKTAILYITGDGPKKGDFVDLNLLAGATRMPIAMLFNIPNQPLWDMKEDDLIAHTFNMYLETKDTSWPLLFPMTKTAISSLDVVQQVARQNEMNFDKFVVTGASKRGWTTWLAAASGDKRIAGIAPMVFDNLKFDAQMSKQLTDWGKYSDQIEDYTRRGLQAQLQTPDGQKLMQMVDPYSYRDRIKVPTLVVNGANDAYWTTDAHKLYWNDLRQPRWLLEVPNSGHGLEDRARVVATVGAFARSVSGMFRMPALKAKPTLMKDAVEYQIESSTEPLSTSVWVAESTTKDFRGAKWKETKLGKAKSARISLAKGVYLAIFIEARYSLDSQSFTLSTPVDVFTAVGE
jgi:PhoPQ-activated pathogenicity-related protein